MGPNEKAEVVGRVVDDINSIKSDLIRQLNKLESVSALRSAKGLERVIASLEAWQARQ